MCLMLIRFFLFLLILLHIGLHLTVRLLCQVDPFFFFSSRRRHTRCLSDWSSDVCSSDLTTHRYAQADAFSTLQSQVFGDRVSSPSFVSGVGHAAGFTFALYGQQYLRYEEHFSLERSEERRVGKECRSRWSTYGQKDKGN